MRRAFVFASVAMLASCGFNGTDGEEGETEAPAPTPEPAGADSMASRDPVEGRQADVAIPDAQERPVMQMQVVLERLGFGPGIIDGESGASTENALAGFQEANGLEITGAHDAATREALGRWSNIPATRVVAIPQEWGRLSFAPTPESPAEQAEMDRLGYQSLDEKLAERFHTTVEVLYRLNPDGQPASAANANGTSSSSGEPAGPEAAAFHAGQQVRVPNVGADRIDPAAIDNAEWRETLASLGVGTGQPDAARIVVDRSAGWLKAYDDADTLVAMFTVTTGSEHDPLPLGEWGVNGVAYNPPFAYDPDLFWDVPDSHADRQLPPGPNGPVGVVWIDLTKEHYGIHGTSEPETIGTAQSHGCVRLTNWDAARLAEMVSGSTQVLFQA